MNLALRIQEAYKHDMAYAEPTNFESNFAKKMDGIRHTAQNWHRIHTAILEYFNIKE